MAASGTRQFREASGFATRGSDRAQARRRPGLSAPSREPCADERPYHRPAAGAWPRSPTRARSRRRHGAGRALVLAAFGGEVGVARQPPLYHFTLQAALLAVTITISSFPGPASARPSACAWQLRLVDPPAASRRSGRAPAAFLRQPGFPAGCRPRFPLMPVRWRAPRRHDLAAHARQSLPKPEQDSRCRNGFRRSAHRARRGGGNTARPARPAASAATGWPAPAHAVDRAMLTTARCGKWKPIASTMPMNRRLDRPPLQRPNANGGAQKAKHQHVERMEHRPPGLSEMAGVLALRSSGRCCGRGRAGRGSRA